MFANPFALLALSLLALPVLIHMLARLSGRRVLFPTIKFLTFTESHRLRLKKIERWPLLILRLVAMGLLVLAVSNPSPFKGKRSRAVVLLLDSSLSMNSEATKERAVSRAREAISSLAAEDSAAVAQFDASVKLLCDFTNDRAALESNIASYGPRYAETDFNQAFAWASGKLAEQARSRELILISDLQSANVNSLAQVQLSGVDLKVLRVNNERHANARIDRVGVRAAGETLEVSSTALFDDGERISIKPISMKFARRGASANNSDSNAFLSAEKIGDDLMAGAVAATGADDFDADDIRFFIARAAGKEEVMIVQPRLTSRDQATFIERAMRANAQADSAAIVAQRSDALPANADALSNLRAIIAPVEALSKNNIAAAREYARKGGTIILTVGAETETIPAMEKLRALDESFSSLALDSIASTDTLSLMLPAARSDILIDDAPSFDPETGPAFASVRFRAARMVHLSDGDALLKYSNNEPAATRVRAGAGQVLLFGFGLSDKDSSLALSPVFPAFIEWLTQGVGLNQHHANLVIGQTPAASLLRGVTRLTRIYSRNGQLQNQEVSDYRNALDEPGVYEAEGSNGKIVFALNTPPAESSLAQSSEQEFFERITINNAEPSGNDSNKSIAADKTGLWRIIAIAALAASLIELVYTGFSRRG